MNFQSINTLELARKFLLLLSKEVFLTPVDSFCSSILRMSTAAFVRAAKKEGVLTPELAKAFKIKFEKEKVNFCRGSRQTKMLLGNLSGEDLNDAEAVLYAVAFLYSKPFKLELEKKFLKENPSVTFDSVKAVELKTNLPFKNLKNEKAFRLDDINTPKRIRQFLLLFAHKITDTSVEESVPYTGLSVSEFADSAQEMGVMTPSLADRFQAVFFGKNLILYSFGIEEESQFNLITDYLDTSEDAELHDEVCALLYSVVFARDVKFRRDLWYIFSNWCHDEQVYFSLEDLDEIEVDETGMFDKPFGMM